MSDDTTLRDTIREAYAKATKELPKDETPEQPEVKQQETLEPAAEEKKVETPTPEKEKPAKPVAKETEQEKAEDEKPAEPKPERQVLAPKLWPKPAREAFEHLSPEVRKVLADHDRELRSGVDVRLREAAEHRKFAESVQHAATPYLPMIREAGSDIPSAVASLLQTAHELRQNPKAVIARLIREYGVDTTELSEYKVPTVDPVLAQTRQELAQLRAHLQQQEQSRAASVQQQHLAEVEQFNPPYLDEVRADMVDILNMGKANGLQDAYDKAIRLNDTVFQAIQSQKAAEKAAKAKSAAKVNMPISGSPTPAPADESLRDTIRRTYRSLTAA